MWNPSTGSRLAQRGRTSANHGRAAYPRRAPGWTGFASGGIHSTVVDLARWGEALFTPGRVVPEKQAALLATLDEHNLALGTATVPLFDRRATVEEATAERPARVIARVPATLAPPVRLAATGTGSRPAVVAAGILLAVGGLAVAVGSGPRPAPRAGARGSRALSAAPGAPVRDQLSLR